MGSQETFKKGRERWVQVGQWFKREMCRMAVDGVGEDRANEYQKYSEIRTRQLARVLNGKARSLQALLEKVLRQG